MAVRALKRSLGQNVSLLRFMSAAAVEPSLKPTVLATGTTFRTSENDPRNHSIAHDAMFYKMPPEVQKQLFSFGGLPKSFERQVKTFGETCLMIRRPALELFEYLKMADYTKPAVRYVLFGSMGSGKTLSMAHVLHYGMSSGWLLFHAPWIPNWLRKPKEVSNSETKEGYVNLPIDAAAWLVHFKTQNAALLKELDLRVSEELVWSKRETTSKDAPLTELIDLGISRVKYASDIIVQLAKEVKLHSTAGRCKTLVVVDGINGFFHPRTRVFAETKKAVPPSKISLTEAFLDITKFDWCNGAIVVSVDQIAVPDDRRECELPLYLLGKEGFAHFDPFVPVHVPEYSDKEIQSCLDYYADRRWIQTERGLSEEGRNELIFLSGKNPYRLMVQCGPL